MLANVTRGGDRQIHYVKTGLTTDVEGSVNSTIRAIKQNQIRYSDIGTINDIFNIVGSLVDVFMPVSIDGERPIETLKREFPELIKKEITVPTEENEI